VLTVVGMTDYLIYLMSRLYQHCQMIQNYLNVELEMAWKKRVIPVFFFGELNKTMTVLSCWACVWTGNETQHL